MTHERTPEEAADTTLLGIAFYEAVVRGDQQAVEAIASQEAVVGLLALTATLFKAYSLITGIPAASVLDTLRHMYASRRDAS